MLAGNARKIADLYWSGKETAYAVRVEQALRHVSGMKKYFPGQWLETPEEGVVTHGTEDQSMDTPKP